MEFVFEGKVIAFAHQMCGDERGGVGEEVCGGGEEGQAGGLGICGRDRGGHWLEEMRMG